MKAYNANCRICGKEFYARSSLLKRGWGKYCSRKCQNKSQKTGKFVVCSYCGKEVYRSLGELRKKSKTKTYFCNKSCQCAWKNKQRSLKNSWRPWCNGSTRVCGTLSEDSNSSGLPTFFSFGKFKKKKTNSQPLKRPSKQILSNLYWKKNYSQTGIAKIFDVTHTSVKRWFNYYKIPIKPRTLSCGRNANSRGNLELGRTEEAGAGSQR